MPSGHHSMHPGESQRASRMPQRVPLWLGKQSQTRTLGNPNPVTQAHHEESNRAQLSHHIPFQKSMRSGAPWDVHFAAGENLAKMGCFAVVLRLFSWQLLDFCWKFFPIMQNVSFFAPILPADQNLSCKMKPPCLLLLLPHPDTHSSTLFHIA